MLGSRLRVRCPCGLYPIARARDDLGVAGLGSAFGHEILDLTCAQRHFPRGDLMVFLVFQHTRWRPLGWKSQPTVCSGCYHLQRNTSQTVASCYNVPVFSDLTTESDIRDWLPIQADNSFDYVLVTCLEYIPTEEVSRSGYVRV